MRRRRWSLPRAPTPTACSGSAPGVNKRRATRSSLSCGIRPARTTEDLPLPEAPTTQETDVEALEQTSNKALATAEQCVVLRFECEQLHRQGVGRRLRVIGQPPPTPEERALEVGEVGRKAINDYLKEELGLRQVLQRVQSEFTQETTRSPKALDRRDASADRRPDHCAPPSRSVPPGVRRCRRVPRRWRAARRYAAPTQAHRGALLVRRGELTETGMRRPPQAHRAGSGRQRRTRPLGCRPRDRRSPQAQHEEWCGDQRAAGRICCPADEAAKCCLRCP